MDRVWRLLGLKGNFTKQLFCLLVSYWVPIIYSVQHMEINCFTSDNYLRLKTNIHLFRWLCSLLLLLLHSTSSWSILPQFDGVAEFSFVQSPEVGLCWTLCGHSKVTLGVLSSTLDFKCFHLLEQFSLEESLWLLVLEAKLVQRLLAL